MTILTPEQVAKVRSLTEKPAKRGWPMSQYCVDLCDTIDALRRQLAERGAEIAALQAEIENANTAI